jgi:5-hydroxyisourate hydrolase
VLDTANGRPAAGVRVTLERRDGDAPGGWMVAGRGVTDADGRLRTLLPEGEPAPAGTYRLTFESGAYFRDHGTAAFHPRVQVSFDVAQGDAHSHVPLLLSPFGYTTYRGS